MKTIAYYISDYGFGHASRSVALIRRLLEMERDIKIIISHSFALRFLWDSFKGENRVAFRPLETDIGYILRKDSTEPDIKTLNAEYSKYMRKWESLIAQETHFLQVTKVDLVISDICAFPFAAAHALNIPSIGISNFTWHIVYQGLIPDCLLGPLKEAYEKMSYFFALAGNNEPDWGRKGNYSFGFFTRTVDKNEVNRIRELVNPTGEKTVVFFGLGMKSSVTSLIGLPLWDSPNCVFLISSNVPVRRPNVFPIPRDYTESQNYIAAADLVISKPGWGTLSEAVCAHRPLLLLDRPAMKEDQHTISFLTKNRLCRTITWSGIKQLVIDGTLIKGMRNHDSPDNPFLSNQTDIITKEVLRILRNQERR